MNEQHELTVTPRRGWLAATAWASGIILAATLVPGAVAAEQTATPRVIVDFEDAKAVELRPQQAATVRVPLGKRHALQITTEAGARYPGVFLESHDRKWDLSEFDAVEMEVNNPEDVAIRVLLGVNNPGADGKQHCNFESVNVPAHDTATLVLPFGTWYGDPGHPIDLKDIVSLEVLLDRPNRSRRFLVEKIQAVRFDRVPMSEVFADPFFQQLKPAFGRGMNLGNALDAPHESDWAVVLKEEYFEQIRAAGFDSVRIATRWSTHADTAPPYRIDAAFFDRVDWAVRQALKRRLAPIVDMHYLDGIMEDPNQHREQFLALWKQIAEHYQDYPPALAFELLNEPAGNLSAEKWNRLLAEGIAVVRRTNPTRLIVIGPAGWNGIAELRRLELPEDDRHLIVTVHYYSPFHFTHQGAKWAGEESQKWLGTKWTGTKEEREAIERDFDTAIAWAVKHHRPLFLGEFGAYGKADLDSRVRWTRFVAEEAVKRKMGFAYWEFCSGFGAFDRQTGRWIQPIKDALIVPPR